MEIDILCSSADHPVNRWLEGWSSAKSEVHNIRIVRKADDLKGGGLLFLISCNEVIGKAVRDLYAYVFVLHASDLPEGRGWSPHVWSLLNGAEEVTVSLLNASDKVDTGDIWDKRRFHVPRDALFDEINTSLFETELALMDRALEMIAQGERPLPQQTSTATYHPRRRPADSEIDPSRPLSELFNAIRVADPERYPAFFRLHGHVYTIQLRKVGEDEQI